MTAIASAVRSLGGDFLAGAFGRAYRIWSQVGDFSDLLTWDDLNVIIARHRLEPPRLRLFNAAAQVPPHEYTHSVVSKRHTVRHRIEPHNLHDQLKGGASLVLDGVEALHPPVEDVATALERHFRTDVQVNLYASWTPTEGFGVHWDDHDVVVLQLEGAKRWRIHGPTRQDPLRVDVEAPEPPTGEPRADFILHPGDMLYLPRGWWHGVAATEGRSLHLTCGLTTTTGADLITWLAGKLLASPIARASLPRFGTEPERKEFVVALRDQLEGALHPEVIEEFIHSRDVTEPGRPVPSLPFVDGIPDDGRLLVRFTTARAAYVVNHEDQAVLTAGGQEWTFAPQVAGVLAPLTRGDTSTLADLAIRSGLSVKSVAAVVTELVAADIAAVSQRR